MAGAEEFQRFTPRIRDDMYLPNEGMTQDILASGTRRKLEDVRRLGDMQAQHIAAMGDAAAGAFQAYQGGKARGLAEEKTKQDISSGALKQQQQQIELERQKGGLAEEQAYRQFLDQPTGGPEGETRRAQLNKATYQAQLDDPTFRKDEHVLKMAEIQKNMKLIDAQLGSLGMNAANAKEAKQRQDAQDAFLGIYTNKNMTPEQQEAAADQLEHSVSGGTKIPPAVVNSYRTAAKNGAISGAQNASLQNQFLVQNTQPFQQMTGATSKAQADAASVNHLTQLRHQYANNLRFGTGGVMSGGEKGPAADARNEFADTLEAMGHHDLADNVRTSGVTGVSDRMDAAIHALAGQAKASWQHDRGGIHPTMANRPEVASTDAMMRDLSGPAPGSEKNNVSLVPGQAPPSGGSANGAFLTGAANKGGQPGGAAPGGGMLIPAGYQPGQTPQQNSQRQGGRLPTQSGMVQPPGMPGAPPPAQSSYPYDFSKYRVNPPQGAAGMANP